MPKIDERCKECGERLLLHPWNDRVDLTKCVNISCNLFAVPVGRRPRSTTATLADDFVPIIRRTKAGKKLGRPKAHEVEYEGTESILEELQGLRDSFRR